MDRGELCEGNHFEYPQKELVLYRVESTTKLLSSRSNNSGKENLMERVKNSCTMAVAI